MMEYSQKTFGSQNVIKQLCRQYSTNFKNSEKEKNVVMTQSSNLPFNKMYNAFNSTGNLNNIGLDMFKHSQAKSIIEKLMQTNRNNQNNQNNQDQENLLLNQLQNIQLDAESTEPIPLNSTENKIFCEMVNMITEIGEIQQKCHIQKQQFQRLKAQLKKQGIQYPQVQQKKSDIKTQIFKRFSKQQLQSMFQQNQKLQKDIDNLTKQLTNTKQNLNQNTVLQAAIKNNKHLKRQLSNIKSEILNSGQIDEEEMQSLNQKVQSLQRDIYLLEQKRLGRLTGRNEEWTLLKEENQKLRQHTIDILGRRNHQSARRRQQLIQIIKLQEQNKQSFTEEINDLKLKYERLLYENSHIKKQQSYQSMRYNDAPLQSYDGPLQVESKVSPFRQTYGEHQFGFDKQNYSRNEKQNYLQNYEPQRNIKAQNMSYAKLSSNYDSRF